MKRLHIGYFTNTYHPNINGVVRSIDSFRSLLYKKGHNVFIFAQGGNDYEDDIPFIFRYPAIQPLKKIDYSVAFPKSMFITKLIPQLKMDVIHSHHPTLLGRVAAQKAQKLNLPLVATFHTQYLEFTRYVPFYQPLVRRAVNSYLDSYWRQCQHIIVPSESMKEELVRKGIKGKITMIPTVIETDIFEKAERNKVRDKRNWGNDFVIISVGRMSKEKNFKLLIKASKIVLDKHPNARLVLIGDGDYRGELEKYCKKLKIENRVEFVGKVHFRDIPYYLKGADLFCFASVTETQGIVTMEALAAELPVVAVNGIGTRDTIQNNVNGLLTSNSSYQLSESISKVILDKNLYQRLKDGAAESAKNLNPVKEVEKLIEVYEEAIFDKKNDYHIEVES